MQMGASYTYKILYLENNDEIYVIYFIYIEI